MPERRTRTHRLTRVGFDTTNWTLVMMAVNQSLPGSRQALEQLCLKYWRPHLRLPAPPGQQARRRSGPGAGILRPPAARPSPAPHPSLQRPAPLLPPGRAAELRPKPARLGAREKTRRRANPNTHGAVEPIETQDPARAFDSQWAAAIFERALGQLKEQYRQAGKGAFSRPSALSDRRGGTGRLRSIGRPNAIDRKHPAHGPFAVARRIP